MAYSFVDFKIHDEANANRSNHKNSTVRPDMSMYLELSTFSEFKRHVMKELEICLGKIEESKNITEDIINVLTTKVTEKDLKFLEG